MNFRMRLGVGIPIWRIKHIFEVFPLLSHPCDTGRLLVARNRVELLRRRTRISLKTLELRRLSFVFLGKVRNHIKYHAFFFNVSLGLNIGIFLLPLLRSVLGLVEKDKRSVRTHRLGSGFSDQARILGLSV